MLIAPMYLMLTENDVVEAVALYLSGSGYSIESTCTTGQTGVDIVAIETASGRRLRVEAKGGTSSKDHTERFGKPSQPWPSAQPRIESAVHGVGNERSESVR